jgi:ribonuclease HII
LKKSESRKPKSDHILRNRFDLAMAAGCSYAGVDEVGRGCLAGPVVAAAIVPPTDIEEWSLVDDSKRLREGRRDEVFSLIQTTARAVGIGWGTVEEIDSLNILRATQLAMGRAIASLNSEVSLVLVDGNHPANTSVASLPIVDGDARSLAIGAASIVAKVYRDRWMKELHEEFPAYGFDTNVGYGTKTHLEALRKYGPTLHHRLSFGPVREVRMAQVRLTI